MNPDNGHLVSNLDEFTNDESHLLKEAYEPLPAHLHRAARKKLNGKKEAYVSLTSGGKLSQWAAGERKKKKKRKQAKLSRRKNR